MSWRVQLLPYLGQAQLYEQFHLDEPWDSTHNKTLVAKMPQVFACPSSQLQPGMTTYLGVAGPKSIFTGDKPVKIQEIIDGTSLTVMIVDASASKAVTWTKPDDLKYDKANPIAGIVGNHAKGFNAALCDGSWRTSSMHSGG